MTLTALSGRDRSEDLGEGVCLQVFTRSDEPDARRPGPVRLLPADLPMVGDPEPGRGGVASSEPSLSWAPPFVRLPGLDWSIASELIAGATFYASALFTMILLGYLGWRIYRSLRP